MPRRARRAASKRRAVKFLIGMTQAEIDALATSGAGWTNITTQSDKTITVDMASTGINGREASWTFAAGLRYARTGTESYKTKVVDACEAVRNWSGVKYYSAYNRKLHGFVLAADLVGHRTQAWIDFLADIRYTTLSGNSRWDSIWKTSWDSANNHGAVARPSLLAINLFIGDQSSTAPDGNPAGIAQDVKFFKGFLGNRSEWSTVAGETSAWGSFAANGWTNAQTWCHDSATWTGINPAAAVAAKEGAIPMDAFRETTNYSVDGGGAPVFGSAGVDYSYTSGMGIVDEAVILAANGYTGVWEWSDQAVKRWREYLSRYGHGHPFNSVTGHIDPVLNHIYTTSYAGTDVEGYGITGTRWLTGNTNWLKA